MKRATLTPAFYAFNNAYDVAMRRRDRLLEMCLFDARQERQLEYVVEVINVGGSHKNGNVTAASTKLEFIQGNLLIDFVGINATENVSEERRTVSLEHLDGYGELAYDVKRCDDSLVDNGHGPVKAYGLIRTGCRPWYEYAWLLNQCMCVLNIACQHVMLALPSIYLHTQVRVITADKYPCRCIAVIDARSNDSMPRCNSRKADVRMLKRPDTFAKS